MNWLVRLLIRLGAPIHECRPFPHCPVCLPSPPETTPFEVRRSAVVVLRSHSSDPFTRKCTCRADTHAYFDHVVEQLDNAGLLATGGGS
jgi:hypothetical protein